MISYSANNKVNLMDITMKTFLEKLLRVSIIIFMNKQKKKTNLSLYYGCGDTFGSSVGIHVQSVDDV